jgi:multicomponent Na+:H+ antiporter subunit C
MIETPFAVLTGLFFSVGIYLMLSKHIVRIVIGIAVFGNAVNLLIFTAGRLFREAAPIIPAGLTTPAGPVANPLPQALILTAIVISFSFLAFILVLVFRAYQEMGTDDTPAMRLAEPREAGLPPLGY